MNKLLATLVLCGVVSGAQAVNFDPPPKFRPVQMSDLIGDWKVYFNGVTSSEGACDLRITRTEFVIRCGLGDPYRGVFMQGSLTEGNYVEFSANNTKGYSAVSAGVWLNRDKTMGVGQGIVNYLRLPMMMVKIQK